jgi:4-diphosphocytidyl-2-C-methyl-D-erythritol kinase
MIKLKSYAKINLFLKVLKKNKFFHKIQTLITQINIADLISIEENRDLKDKIIFYGPFKPKIEKNNTIYKVLNLLRKHFPILRKIYFKILINKKIPHGSGLGGASSNAAVIFNYLVLKYKILISEKKKISLLSKIGMDCPLFINQRPKFVFSYGEKFYTLNKNINFNVLLIYPNLKLSTKKVFKHNKVFSNKIVYNSSTFDEKKLKKDLVFFKNDLYVSASTLSTKISEITNFISKFENLVLCSMTGSGSCCFAIFKDKKSLLNAKKIAKKRFKTYWTVVTKTIN